MWRARSTAQEQRELGHILRLADAAQAVLRHQLLARLIRRDAARLRALLQQRNDAVGLGQARMDHVDVHAVLLAEPGEPLGEIRHRGIDRAADRNSASGVRAAPPMMLTTWPSRFLQHRPEQFREPHAGEIFQREAVVERLVGQFEEIAAARRARIVHQHVAAPGLVLHEGVQRLAGLELFQIAREGERLRPGIADLGRGLVEILLRGCRQHGLRALARERSRDRLADAAAAAGHHNDFAGKLAHLRPSLSCVAELVRCIVRPINGAAS